MQVWNGYWYAVSEQSETPFLAGIIAGLTAKKGRKAFVPQTKTGLNCMSKEYLNFLNYDGTVQV